MSGDEQWVSDARKQQEYMRIPHQYRIDLRNNMDELKTMIAYGFCGLPENSENSTDSYNENSDFISLYSNETQTLINSAVDAVLNDYNDTHIYLAITYLLCKLRDNNGSYGTEAKDANISNLVPVCIFGFSSLGENYKFIDSQFRIYSNWENFLANNRLPPCQYCYPEGGIYTSSNEMLITRSPSSTTLSRVARQADTVSVFACLSAGIGSFFVANPIGLSIVGGTVALTGSYNVVRSTYKLYDRKCHRQSIWLSEPSSRNAWFNIASTALTAGAAGATAQAASLTERYGVAAARGLMVLNGTIIAIDVLGICNSVHNIILKWTNNELELIDVGLLCLQLLFVSGTLLNARQLFNKLSNMNGTNANINKTLTKTQKQSLRERLAGALSRRNTVNVAKVDNLSSNSEVSTVTFDAFTKLAPDFGLTILYSLCPRAEVIFRHIKSILNDYDLMMRKLLKPVSFIKQTTTHVQNLMAILKEELSVLNEKVFSFFSFFQTEQEQNNAATSLDNGVTEINSIISDALEEETTNITNMVPVRNDIIIESLCKFLIRFSRVICGFSSTCGLFEHLAVVNYEELVQAYRMTMISAINQIMSRLPSVMNDERFRNNEQLFGTPVALTIKSYEDRKIFEDAVSNISPEDLYKSSARQVISRRRREYNPSNIEFWRIEYLADCMISALKRIRKEDNRPFLYQYALILLKRFLSKLSDNILSADTRNFFVLDCEPDLISALDLLRLENDHFQSYCYMRSSEEQNSNSDEVSSVQSITKDTTMKYRKIFEISCLCLYKLQNAGFNAPPGVSIGKLITILIDFVKTKLVNEFRNNRTNYVSQRDSIEIFIKLIDLLNKQIFTDDLFLAECIEFCQSHFERVDHVLIWEGVLKDEGVKSLTLYGVNDFETLRDRLEKELKINLWKFNRVPNNDVDNFYAFTINDSYTGYNIDMITAYSGSESSNEYFIIIHEKKR